MIEIKTPKGEAGTAALMGKLDELGKEYDDVVKVVVGGATKHYYLKGEDRVYDLKASSDVKDGGEDSSDYPDWSTRAKMDGWARDHGIDPAEYSSMKKLRPVLERKLEEMSG